MSIASISEKRYENALKHGKPVSLIKIAKQVAEKDVEKIRNVYKDISMNFSYDILNEATIWDLFNGEPLHSIIPHMPGHKLAIFEINNKRASCKLFNIVPPPLGSIVYEKSNTLKEIGEVVESKQESSWKMPIQVKVDLTRKPEGELYVECRYRLYIKGGKQTIENLIQSIVPKNPSKLLRYLKRRGEIPSLKVNEQDLGEFIYDNWNGNLEELKESLHKEFITS